MSLHDEHNPFIQHGDNTSKMLRNVAYYPNCFFQSDCTPGLVLSDSEESFSSCGADEFFEMEDITNALRLIDTWKKRHRRVRFDCTRVQEYAITVGDHPVCQGGLALSLDWSHAGEHVYNVDDFEHKRRRKNRRRGVRRRTSKLDYWQRREILTRVGSYSNSDLARIESEHNKVAVSEFLADGGLNDFGVLDDDGVGIEQVYSAESFSCSAMREDEWQMTIQILED
jgi:hypothetical protein